MDTSLNPNPAEAPISQLISNDIADAAKPQDHDGQSDLRQLA
jgi:hypothetical protein